MVPRRFSGFQGSKEFCGVPEIIRGLKGPEGSRVSQGSRGSSGVARVPGVQGLGSTFPPCQMKFDLKSINQEFLLFLKLLKKRSIHYFTIEL